MIKTEKLKTTVIFGSEENASIAVAHSNRKMVLRMLSAKKQVGENLNEGDIQDLPVVEIEFININSIDILIGILLSIKKNDTHSPHLGQFDLVC